MRSVYYPATESTTPPASIDTYRHRDYSDDFDTKPQWTAPAEDPEGFVTWGSSGNAMSWTAGDFCEGYGHGCGCSDCMDAEQMVAAENGDLT